MGFLLKAAFWLAVVVMLLPAPEDRQVVSQHGVPVDGTEAIGVARDLVADMSGFCTRNPEACDTGIAAAQAFGIKAQHGAKMLYDYLEQFNDGEDVALSAAPAGNAAAPVHTASQQGAVTHVQSIRIPVLNQGVANQGQAIGGQTTGVTAANSTVPASSAGLETSTWQADPLAGLGSSAWRQPLSRAELARQTQNPGAQDAIGLLIRQSQ